MKPNNRIQDAWNKVFPTTTADETPPSEVLDWCRNLVRIMADQAVWGIPRSQTIFRIDKQRQRLVLITPGNDDRSDFLATKKVFAHIGWDVVEAEERDNGSKEKV